MSWALSCLSLRENYDDVAFYTDSNGYKVLIKLLKLPYTDVLVWKSNYTVIYVGGERIYHTHSSGVCETGDLMRYWVKTFECPAVYRKK